MKKIYLLLLLSSFVGYSQAVYVLVGKNHANFGIKSNGIKNTNLTNKGIGDSYEIGIAIPIAITRLPFDNPLNYNLGLTLNQYNAESGNRANHYEWKTEFIGVQNTIAYSFIKTNHLDVAVKGSFNLGTIVSGSQLINNSFYTISNHKEFKGLQFTPSLGLQTQCNLSEYAYLSLGYNYASSYNLSNTTNEKVTIHNHQLLFGVHLELY